MPKAGNLGIDPTSGYLRLRQSSHVVGPGGADRSRSEFVPHPMFDLSEEVGLEAEVPHPARMCPQPLAPDTWLLLFPTCHLRHIAYRLSPITYQELTPFVFSNIPAFCA